MPNRYDYMWSPPGRPSGHFEGIPHSSLPGIFGKAVDFYYSTMMNLIMLLFALIPTLLCLGSIVLFVLLFS